MIVPAAARRFSGLPAGDLAQRYARIRQYSLTLAAPLSAEDCQVQSMPDASPTKWHLAHITWFFETFILERHEADFRAFDPAFRVLFNSYYQGVGEQYPRPQRGLITRPTLDEVKRYRADVDGRMQTLLANRSDHSRRAMSDVQAANSAGKIQIPVAVNVLDDCAVRAGCENRRSVGRAAGNCSLAARQ